MKTGRKAHLKLNLDHTFQSFPNLRFNMKVLILCIIFIVLEKEIKSQNLFKRYDFGSSNWTPYAYKGNFK